MDLLKLIVKSHMLAVLTYLAAICCIATLTSSEGVNQLGYVWRQPGDYIDLCEDPPLHNRTWTTWPDVAVFPCSTGFPTDLPDDNNLDNTTSTGFFYATSPRNFNLLAVYYYEADETLAMTVVYFSTRHINVVGVHPDDGGGVVGLPPSVDGDWTTRTLRGIHNGFPILFQIDFRTGDESDFFVLDKIIVTIETPTEPTTGSPVPSPSPTSSPGPNTSPESFTSSTTTTSSSSDSSQSLSTVNVTPSPDPTSIYPTPTSPSNPSTTFPSTEIPRWQHLIENCGDENQLEEWLFSIGIKCTVDLPVEDLPIEDLELGATNSTGFFYFHDSILLNSIVAHYNNATNVEITLTYYSTQDFTVENVETEDGRPGIVKSVGSGWSIRTLMVVQPELQITFDLRLVTAVDFLVIDKIVVTFQVPATPYQRHHR